ncbi:hypothetical protein Sru01_00130 [Sphaerisporangium rufum]|uniref:Tetratricopeptide repeat protein n=1 Tax=Sphaerisporangium rufum TaxID=1381558 RepID=A0A919QYC8_9ACTN|nr:tetratricopeptide repeat protein [Sphaerisporangium rufum]GII75031.1 hypothetical protein Sru01_00130 [Sphaerisporangium rufum]
MSDLKRPRGRAAAAAAKTACVVAATLAITAGATLLPPIGHQAPAVTPAGAEPGAGPPQAGATGLSTTVRGLRDRLQRLPKDHQAWAALGAAHVQQARITADPSYYVKAEQALDRAAALAPRDAAVLAARASLAAGRHEFAAARRLARQAIDANPYGATAYGVLADAATQLGEHAEATRAVRRMTELKPGVASFTRASYDAELRGDVREAEELLKAALADAFTPEDIAYCRFYLGELALRAGELERAGHMYDEALRAYPAFVPALAGRARAAALAGRLESAAQGYQDVVARLPLAQYIVEYGEVLARLGRSPAGQWALLSAQRRLMAASGVRDDITWAEFEADHGSPAAAVKHARAEYRRHPNLVSADALAWALHRDGRSREALRYARKATARGWRNALFHHHRAEIERKLGLDAGRSRSRVKEYNPRFDPALPALARFS